MSEKQGNSGLPSLPMVPQSQLIPSKTCLACDVCCRFPEPDSFLRPYFAREEITEAIKGGVDASHFADEEGCQIAVVPHPYDDGYLCPAFDPETSHCQIYEVRPLDCQIYPFTVMWNAERSAVLLGWDQKCPFMMMDASVGVKDIRLLPEAQAHAHQLHERLEADDAMVQFIQRNRKVVTPYQEDVVVVAQLERLTKYFSSPRSSP